MYLLAKEVISRYCSTGGLLCFAQGSRRFPAAKILKKSMILITLALI